MTAILGTTELLLAAQGEQDEPEVVDADGLGRVQKLQMIFDSANALLQIINDILDLSKGVCVHGGGG